MLNTTELVLFVLVVEAKSFNKAAKTAGISTPALSKRISKLEGALGVQLLHRTTRRLSLTDAGEILYKHAANINKQVNDAFGALSPYSKSLSGPIRITIPTISGELFLAEIIAEFCKKHPSISIDVQLGNSFTDLVKDGFDLAIRTGELPDSSLIAKRLITSNWVVCCSPKYIAENGQPSSLEDLQAHNCLAYTYQNKGAYDWRFTQNEQAHMVQIRGNFNTNNAQALRKAALAGYGIVYVPKCSVYEDLEKGELVLLLRDFKARSLGVYAVYPFTRYVPEKIRLLIEHIKEGYLKIEHYF